MKPLILALITSVFGFIFLSGEHAIAQAPNDDGSRAFIKTQFEKTPAPGLYALNEHKTRTIIVDTILTPKKSEGPPYPVSVTVAPGQSASLGAIPGPRIKIVRTHFAQ